MESLPLSVVKYLLFIFNLLFAISGIGIIVAGAIVLADVADFDHFMDSKLLAPPVVLIVAGAIVFIVAFLGCFGAIRESYKPLITFAVCLFVIFIIELAVGIAAASYKNEFAEILQASLKKSMSNYTQNELERIAWDKAQSKLKCCGVEGPQDWTSGQPGQPIPYSCCHVESTQQAELSNYCINAAKGKYLQQTGCYDKLKMKVNENTKVLIGVGIGIAFVEIVGIVLALWLAKSIKNGESTK